MHYHASPKTLLLTADGDHPRKPHQIQCRDPSPADVSVSQISLWNRETRSLIAPRVRLASEFLGSICLHPVPHPHPSSDDSKYYCARPLKISEFGHLNSGTCSFMARPLPPEPSSRPSSHLVLMKRNLNYSMSWPYTELIVKITSLNLHTAWGWPKGSLHKKSCDRMEKENTLTKILFQHFISQWNWIPLC